jgi:glutamate synthase (NADPH/NADH) small chain
MEVKYMTKAKTPMKQQDPLKRINNFLEVPLGYSEEEAIIEAERCLQCKNPTCISGCPVNINIPGFIKKIKEKDFEGAINIIKETNSLPAICGRVCPQENQCEKSCVYSKMPEAEPVAIGRLERFAADYERLHSLSKNKKSLKKITSKKSKVAIIGAGPAGLAASAELASMGYDVTVFEAFHKAGGVLIYGIPEFRLPKDIVASEIKYLESLGVKFIYNIVVGKSLTFEDLKRDGYKAMFIGIGAGTPRFMGIKGTNLNGIYSSSEFLTRVNLMKAYDFPKYDTPIKIGKHVLVIGAGNVAMDSARTALRLGSENVTVVYRRSEKEMPARLEEYHHAMEEGIHFEWLTSPIEYIDDGNGNVNKAKCIKYELGEPDESGRRRPVKIPGSEFFIETDMVIEAIGQTSNKLLPSSLPELKLNKKGYIEINEETMATSIKGVFAGGDIVTGAATVILAMGAGKKAAKNIDKYLSGELNPWK